MIEQDHRHRKANHDDPQPAVRRNDPIALTFCAEVQAQPGPGRHRSAIGSAAWTSVLDSRWKSIWDARCGLARHHDRPGAGDERRPARGVTVKGSTVEFALKAAGDPGFTGTLSADGKTITGTFSQGGGSIPLVLAWKGEPQFAAAVKNAAVSPGLVGSWEGTLDVKGTMLRLALTLANGADGATGKLVSLDQSNFEMPVDQITEEGSRLKLGVPMVSGGSTARSGGANLRDVDAGPLALPWCSRSGRNHVLRAPCSLRSQGHIAVVAR